LRPKTRRTLFKGIIAGLTGTGLTGFAAVPPGAGAPPNISGLSPEDDAFLNDLEHANFLFFQEQAGASSGMVRDRANVRTPVASVLSSIAATGFGLTAMCIGQYRNFIS